MQNIIKLAELCAYIDEKENITLNDIDRIKIII